MPPSPLRRQSEHRAAELAGAAPGVPTNSCALPLSRWGPQQPDQAPQGIFEAQVAQAEHQQKTAQLVQLPALLALGGGEEGLLQRLIDGIYRRIHSLFVERAVLSSATGCSHLWFPSRYLIIVLRCKASVMGRSAWFQGVIGL